MVCVWVTHHPGTDTSTLLSCDSAVVVVDFDGLHGTSVTLRYTYAPENSQLAIAQMQQCERAANSLFL
jgi:hypothetical protein